MLRKRISLDGSWEFLLDREQSLQPDTLKDAGTPRSIRVPGPWQAQFEDLRNYSGVAWYRREFELPLTDSIHTNSDKTYILHFGAVDYFATVWLNNQLIGEHEGGYLPFDLKLDDALRLSGSNELVVRVVDPGDHENLSPNISFAEIPHGKQSWYGPIGGIWQSVYVEARHATHITQLHITPDVANAQAQINLRLNRRTTGQTWWRLTLTDPRGAVTIHNLSMEDGEDSLRTVLPVPDPLLWDTRSPHLYHLEAALLAEEDDGAVLDTFDSHFGMRSIAASRDGHLMLNGRILFLRGALDRIITRR